MRIDRVWAMPSKHTFLISPIRDLIQGEMGHPYDLWIDPFAGFNSPANITNDLNPDAPTAYHLEALDFLKEFSGSSITGVLFDPPYSPRQVSECYKKLGKTVNMQTTQSSYWTKLKTEIARIVEPRGKVLTCGWNSGGVGKKLGFDIEEILLVAHGGWHNDTICTVERKII